MQAKGTGDRGQGTGRRAAPKLVAGWDKADEERYNAEAAGEIPPAEQEANEQKAAKEAKVEIEQEKTEETEGKENVAQNLAPRATFSSPLPPLPPVPDLVPNGLQAALDDRPKLEFAEAVLGHLSPEAGGYQTRHVELQLTPAEKDLVARLRTGLWDAHAQIECGPSGRTKHVESANDAVRWLLQQVDRLAAKHACERY